VSIHENIWHLHSPRQGIVACVLGRRWFHIDLLPLEAVLLQISESAGSPADIPILRLEEYPRHTLKAVRADSSTVSIPGLPRLTFALLCLKLEPAKNVFAISRELKNTPNNRRWLFLVVPQ
jgi:hypothetical protein